MTGLREPSRGGPSDLHEHRSATLVTMATLTGHLCPLGALFDGSRPDVLQLRPRDGSLFVGDAKATETPGNAETFDRLSHYSDCLSLWLAAGNPGVLALTVRDADAFGWLQVLRELTRYSLRGVLVPVPGQVDHIEIGTAVVWQSFPGSAM